MENQTQKANDNELVDLKNIREEYRSKAFRMMLDIAFIFGIPAAAAFFGGRKLDALYGTGNTVLISLLIGAFISSWIVVIIQYRKINKQLKEVDEKIKKQLTKQNESSSS